MTFVIAAIFVIVFAIVGGTYWHRRSEAFEGVITDKDIRETRVNNNQPGSSITIGSTGGVEHTYIIKVQTDAGKTISYPISEGKYEQAAIGDRVSKRSGTTDVDITKQAASPTSTPPVAPPSAQQ